MLGASYQSTVAGQSPTAYYKLDNSFADANAGASLVAEPNSNGGSFDADVFGNSTGAYRFRDSNHRLKAGDIVNGGTGSGVGSVTLLFRALTGPTAFQRYILFQTNLSGSAFSVYFENNNGSSPYPQSLTLKVGNHTEKMLDASAIVYGQWYYLALTWDEQANTSEVKWYIGLVGGTLSGPTTVDISNSSVIGNDKSLFIGNRLNDTGGTFTSGFRDPGEGSVDEIAFWNSRLTDPNINAQFNALPGNQPPTVAEIESRVVNVGANVAIAVHAYDNPSQTLTYSKVSGDGSINATTGAYTYNSATAGSHPVTIRVSDGTVNVDKTFCIVVDNTARPSDNFDLTHWNLTLPVQDSTTHQPREITTAQLTGFEFVDSSDCGKSISTRGQATRLFFKPPPTVLIPTQGGRVVNYERQPQRAPNKIGCRVPVTHMS